MRTEAHRVVLPAVVLVVIAAGVFRVVTAPDRMRERQATARAVCTEGGGLWMGEGRDAVCVKPEGPGAGAPAR